MDTDMIHVLALVGGWKEVARPEWDEKRETYAGYEKPERVIGHEYSALSVLAYYRSAKASPAAGPVAILALWNCDTRQADLGADDDPSLVKILGDLGAIASAAISADEQNAKNDAREKDFRKRHGHDIHESCEDCDPFGAARQREMEQEREKRRAERASVSNPSPPH